MAGKFEIHIHNQRSLHFANQNSLRLWFISISSWACKYLCVYSLFQADAIDNFAAPLRQLLSMWNVCIETGGNFSIELAIRIRARTFCFAICRITLESFVYMHILTIFMLVRNQFGFFHCWRFILPTDPVRFKFCFQPINGFKHNAR